MYLLRARGRAVACAYRIEYYLAMCGLQLQRQSSKIPKCASTAGTPPCPWPCEVFQAVVDICTIRGVVRNLILFEF